MLIKTYSEKLLDIIPDDVLIGVKLRAGQLKQAEEQLQSRTKYRIYTSFRLVARMVELNQTEILAEAIKTKLTRKKAFQKIRHENRRTKTKRR